MSDVFGTRSRTPHGMLTVREILTTLPAGTQVVAGTAGIDREVTWVAGLRTRPPVFPTLKGGELALVAVATLERLEPVVHLVDAVKSLADRGVAAIGVLGPIDASAIAEAERRGVPLLALPCDTLLHELESTLVRLIGEHRTELYQWGIEIEHRLADASIRGDGLGGMLSLLARLLKAPVIWHDALGRPAMIEVPPAASLSVADVRASLVDAERGGFSRPPTAESAARLPCALPGWTRWGVRVAVGRSTVGHLSLLIPETRAGTRERLALERAAWAFAQEAAKERAVQAAESRLRGDFLITLLTTPARELAEVQLRSRQLGLDLSLPIESVVFRITLGTADGADTVVDVLERRLSQVALGSSDFRAWLDDDHLVALIPATVGGKRVAADAIAAVDQVLGTTAISAGVGRAYSGAEGIRTSFQEAKTALEIGIGLHGVGHVTAFTDLGVYRLLYALREQAELADFFTETLGALERYDQENNTELLRTLETYFACDGVIGRAADQLYLHRNSLAYRLRRIEEITGLSLQSAEARFRMQLALKIWRLRSARNLNIAQ